MGNLFSNKVSPSPYNVDEYDSFKISTSTDGKILYPAEKRNRRKKQNSPKKKKRKSPRKY